MSAVTCGWCESWIEESNVRWPGFCSAGCRDAERSWREQQRDVRRQVKQVRAAKWAAKATVEGGDW